ncbi:MAG: Holliday junction resolvase RuvX [bacterium]|nr:MAG: Holliday junction resolvase RuvX [bacterium]
MMSNHSQIGRILGIDYGFRRIGIALSDPLRISAQTLPTIKVQGLEQVISELERIVRNKNVTEIVVGMPLNLKGEKSRSAQKVEKFIQQLENRFRLPVHCWDERWTSLAAQRTIHEFGKSPSRHKDKIDQISALLILQSFLDYLSAKTGKEAECS